jgi:uncharacterized protein (DUF983 family)
MAMKWGKMKNCARCATKKVFRGYLRIEYKNRQKSETKTGKKKEKKRKRVN